MYSHKLWTHAFVCLCIVCWRWSVSLIIILHSAHSIGLCCLEAMSSHHLLFLSLPPSSHSSPSLRSLSPSNLPSSPSLLSISPCSLSSSPLLSLSTLSLSSHSSSLSTAEEKAVAACCGGNVAALQAILQAGVSVNHTSGATSSTLLHLSAYCGQVGH